MTAEDQIVQAIIRDLRERKTLRQVWDCELESREKRQIMREWRHIVGRRIGA